MNNAPAQRQPAHPVAQGVQRLLAANMKAIQSALPKHMTPERMARVAFTTINKTPALLKCTPESLVMAIVEAATLGLEIDSRGLAYIVPYGSTVTLIPGYKGLMDLAYRSGRVTSIFAEVVCENDKFTYRMGTDPSLEHTPELNDRGTKIAVYAVAKFKDADPAFVVLGKTEVEKVRRASKAAASGPWKDWEDEMWKKTAIRRLCKYLPLSPEMQRAVAMDEAADAGLPQELGGGVLDLEPQTVERATSPADLNAALDSPAATATAPIDDRPKVACPDRGDTHVLLSFCDQCAKRAECPAH